MGGLLCCSSKEQEVLRESGPEVELGGVALTWGQDDPEQSWEVGPREPGAAHDDDDDVFRLTSPDTSKDMASFPFSPRPTSPSRVSISFGDRATKSTAATSIVNPGDPAIQEPPVLVPAFRTSASTSEPFSSPTPSSPSSHQKFCEEEALADASSSVHFLSHTRGRESLALSPGMAVFPAALPIVS